MFVCARQIVIGVVFSIISITSKFMHDIENLKAFLLVWNTFLIIIFCVIFFVCFYSLMFNLLGIELYSFFICDAYDLMT
jgi:hypothetical protein